MDKNIVVTGSGGILGTAILNKLSKNSRNQIYAISSQVEKMEEKYKGLEHIHVLSSVSDISNVNIDIAIHCAFPRSNNGKDLATAFEYTEMIMTELASKGIRVFINISSQSVYAQSGEEIQTETSAVEPSNLYGMTKYAIENLVRIKANQYDMKYVNVRLGSLASPTFDQRMINRFFQKIVNKEPIIVDRGVPKVSYLHVEDAADALIQLINAISQGRKIRSLYNLANNDWMFIKELVESCLEYGEKIGLQSSDLSFSEKISEYNNVVNSDLFYKDMNWEPKYSMKSLIEIIFDEKLK